MNGTLIVRVVKEEVLTFAEWVRYDLPKTLRRNYQSTAEYEAALTREWNRIINESKGTVHCELGLDEQDLEGAFEDFNCTDEDDEVVEIPTLSQEAADIAEDERLQALGLDRIHHNYVDYLWDPANSILLDLQQNRVGTFDGITFTLDQQ